MDSNQSKYLKLGILSLVLLVVGVATWQVVFDKPAQKCNDFPVAAVELHSKEYKVFLAQEICQLQQGLMNKTSLEGKDGMLFIFPKAQKLSFWMKDTKMDLSIAFISDTGEIVEIFDMDSPPEGTPDSALKTYSSQGPVQFAFEAPKGFFTKEGIKVGDRLGFFNREGSSLDSGGD